MKFGEGNLRCVGYYIKSEIGWYNDKFNLHGCDKFLRKHIWRCEFV